MYNASSMLHMSHINFWEHAKPTNFAAHLMKHEELCNMKLATLFTVCYNLGFFVTFAYTGHVHWAEHTAVAIRDPLG